MSFRNRRVKRLRALPVVEVIWTDAHGGTESWVDNEVVKEIHAPATVRSTGILFRQNRKGVTVAQSCNLEDDKWDHTLFIPFGNIVTIRTLRRPK